MFCVACGTPLASGLSYCNRCGTSLKERSKSRTIPVAAFLAAITVIGVVGMGLMLSGALVLKKEADLPVDVVGFFMFFTFLITIIIELSLFRQLSKLTGVSKPKKMDAQPAFPQQFGMPNQLRSAQPLGEPVASVTENTTRTLEYSRNEP